MDGATLPNRTARAQGSAALGSARNKLAGTCAPKNAASATQSCDTARMAGITRSLVALVLLAGLLGRARADAPAPTVGDNAGAPAGYQEAADLALEEFAHGNYLEARARFQKAHEIWPNARSLRALGYCEYELKNYAAALELLRGALASQVRPLSATQRQETEQLEARTRGYVARYIITTVPAEARLTLDGADLTLDAQHATTMNMGQHTLEASAASYQTVRRSLQAEGGSQKTLLLELPRIEAPVAAAPIAEQRDEPLRKQWWLWTSVGVVVVAGVTAGLVAALHDPGTRDPSGGTIKDTFWVSK
jgi:tetratricopeptide (TPR) repeat protein